MQMRLPWSLSVLSLFTSSFWGLFEQVLVFSTAHMESESAVFSEYLINCSVFVLDTSHKKVRGELISSSTAFTGNFLQNYEMFPLKSFLWNLFWNLSKELQKKLWVKLREDLECIFIYSHWSNLFVLELELLEILRSFSAFSIEGSFRK